LGILPWKGRPGKIAVAGAVAVAALMAFALPTGLASAATVVSNSSPSASWAYGAVTSINFSGTSASGVPYTGNATYGFTVLINQTNLSSTEFELSISRVTGASFSVEYCYPTCRSPTYHVGLSERAWQQVDSVSYLVDNGSVEEASGAVPAYALVNASSVQTSNLTESYLSYVPESGTPVTRTGYLGVQVAADASVSFATPLGLFPTNLSSSQSWESSSAFVAQADASYAFFASRSGPLGSGQASSSGAIPIETSGNVTVQGSYATSNSIVLGGLHYPEVVLLVQGPFTLQEGVIILPAASDLFQGGNQPWSSNASAVASSSMSYVDFRGLTTGHFGLGASRWEFNAATLNPASSAGLSAGSDVAELAGTGTPDSAPPTYVQGQPESAAQSGSVEGCLVAGAGCPNGASSSGPLHGLFGLLALGAVIVVVAVVAVAIVERRRLPPPTYPNAALYPPGANGGGRVGSPSTPPPPAPDEDPLGNLW
jgi:hypothetical protein